MPDNDKLRVYGRTFPEPSCPYGSLIETRIRDCEPARNTLFVGLIPALGVTAMAANVIISLTFDNEYGMQALAWKTAVVIACIQFVYAAIAFVVFAGVV
jgi:hypothetical protein